MNNWTITVFSTPVFGSNQGKLPNEFAIEIVGGNKNKIILPTHQKKTHQTNPRNTSNIRSSFALLFYWLFTLPSGNIAQSISFFSLDVCRIQTVLLSLNKSHWFSQQNQWVLVNHINYIVKYSCFTNNKIKWKRS